MAKYQATSRTLYRGCWFFDFLAILMEDFEKDRDLKCSVIALKAYNQALAPYHPWALKKIASIAMKAIRARDKVVVSVLKEQSEVQKKEYTEEDFYNDAKQIGEKSREVAKHLWAFCKENEFDKLP